MKTKQLTEQKVFTYIGEHHMLIPGDRVVAGISGGADSVCLLFVLLEYAKRIPIELAVVHVNHGIRKEAGEDAAFVEKLCRELGIPFYPVEGDVRRKAQEEKCSEEDAGRRVRYEAFARVAKEWGASKIAVAHNSNDRSETMLFHLFRGSGIKGLSSIQPVRDNIIRPILCLERTEIEQYLQEQGIVYCQDATNETDDYTRNRIRHHVIPYVEQEIVQGCVQHMAQTAEMLSEAEDYLERQTADAVAHCVTENATLKAESMEVAPGQGYRISVDKFLNYHVTIQKRILHTLVKTLSPGHKDISYVHIQDLRQLFLSEGNRSVNLPFGIVGRREYQKVLIGIAGRDNSVSATGQNYNTQKEITIHFPQENESAECFKWSCEVVLGERMVMKLVILPKEQFFTGELPQNEYTKWFDYDKIKRYTAVRYRRTGDYLTIADGKGGMRHKSLKDYMISQKIPREQRDGMLLLAEDNHVIWLPGYRISEYYKISENTKRILQVQLVGEENANSETEENNGRAY